jgi:hypothetical protein
VRYKALHRPSITLKFVAVFGDRWVLTMREVLSIWLPARRDRTRLRRKAAHEPAPDQTPNPRQLVASSPLHQASPPPLLEQDSISDPESSTEPGSEREVELEADTASERTMTSQHDSPSSRRASLQAIPPQELGNLCPLGCERKQESLDHELRTSGQENVGPSEIIESQPEFRKRFFKNGQGDRLLRSSDGYLFRVIPMMMNGDCGFAAIAKAVNLLAAEVSITTRKGEDDHHRRKPVALTRTRVPLASASFFGTNRRPKEVTPREIRRSMAEEVATNRLVYSTISSGIFTDSHLTAFVKNVVRPGMTGHWLGAEIGGLEFVAVARALNVTLAIYCFDVPSQTVRRFEEAKSESSNSEICLFFTGPAASGHFDLLWNVPPLSKSNAISSRMEDV